MLGRNDSRKREFIFVELPKFKPTTFSERKMQVLWLRFLTEIDEHTKEAPAELLENAEVKEALEIVESAAFNDAERRSYDKFWDNVSVQKTLEADWKRKAAKLEAMAKEVEAKADALKTQVNEAEAKAKQEKIEAARKLKETGLLSTQRIAEIIGLTTNEIEAL